MQSEPAVTEGAGRQTAVSRLRVAETMSSRPVLHVKMRQAGDKAGRGLVNVALEKVRTS